MVTHALAPRPTVWASATRAPATWRGAGGAAQLPRELDHLAERRCAERLALREQPAARVDRQRRATSSPPPSRTQAPPPRRGHRPELLDGEDLARRIGVLHLGDVEVRRGRARRHRRRRAPPSRSGVGTVSPVRPRERRVLAQHRAGEVRAQHRRPRCAPAAAAGAAETTTAAAPSLGAHSMSSRSGSHTTRRAEHVVDA